MRRCGLQLLTLISTVINSSGPQNVGISCLTEQLVASDEALYIHGDIFFKPSHLVKAMYRHLNKIFWRLALPQSENTHTAKPSR